MAIPEAQLETWSHQGSVTQSAQTYKAITGVLNDSSSPYYQRDFSTFLQGSYGNDTNVYRDSDVDIVICLNQTYYADINNLGQEAKENYNRAFSRASYDYSTFRAEVLAWLQKNYGNGVSAGKKAIFIPGNGTRRDTDVLVCAKHRRYRASSTGVDSQYDEGIIFWTSDGTKIINFPKQHSQNCTQKHQATHQNFKGLVRIYKNMRNSMVDNDVIADGVAPSYFLEGMLWNVPQEQFVGTREDSFVNSFNWIVNSNRGTLTCANALHWLVRDDSAVSWPTSNFVTYLAAAQRYWNEWGK